MAHRSTYFLHFGNLNTGPTPALTLHDKFSLVAATGAEARKVSFSKRIHDIATDLDTNLGDQLDSKKSFPTHSMQSH